MDDSYKSRPERIYGKYSPALRASAGGRFKVVEPVIAASRGRYNEDGTTSQHLEINESGSSNTLTGVAKDNLVVMPSKGVRVRRLTARESWRLMSFDDEDFDKARKVCSDSQLYKQAGNSIVVKVLEEIIKQLQEVKAM